MEKSRFNGLAGSLERTKEIIDGEEVEYEYFVPSPLPQTILLTPQMVNKIKDAYLCIGELKGSTKNIGGTVGIFSVICKKREAVLSSKIEGTRVSLTDVFLNEAGHKERNGFGKEIVEVLNYAECVDFALDRIKRGEKINKDLITNMHYVLLKGTRGYERCSGDFRKLQNWVGKHGTIKAAEFVPPHAKYVPKLMDSFFEFMEGQDNLPELVKIALMHYYFETIRPFGDGNGRLGRTLIILYLIKLKIINEPILYLSSYLEKHREEYYNALMEVRYTGYYENWILFFLEGIIQISKETSQRIDKLIELYEGYKDKLNSSRAKPLSYALLDSFFENPYATISRLQKKLKARNYPLVQRGINDLRDLGIIKEITGGRRNRYYVAQKVLDILENG